MSEDRLEQRSLAYRFDAEALPWDRADAPGRFAGAFLLGRLGLADFEADDRLQWAFAAVTARAFVALEEDVAAFVTSADSPLRSATLLLEEERKHIGVFRRVADLLDARWPDGARALDAVWRPPVSWGELREAASVDDPEEARWLFWAATLVFEEYTVWIHHALEADAGIQPLWSAVHAAHRREEVQHVLTDALHLERLELDAPARRRLGRAFLLWLERHVDRFLCLDVLGEVWRRLAPEAPALPVRGALAELDLLADLESHPAFRFTRIALPDLTRLARPRTAQARGRALSPDPSALGEHLDAAAATEETLTLVGHDGCVRTWSWGELASRATRALGGLEAAGVPRGALVPLLATDPAAFVVGWWGCVLGGRVPAPIAPPGRAEGAEADRLFGVASRCDGPVLVDDGLAPSVADILKDRGLDRPVLGVEALASGRDGGRVRASADDVAFVQFSSGSTAHPHGIRLTHANLVADARAMLAHRGEPPERFVSWLPLFHDMGLIGYHITPVVGRASSVLVPPERFMARPRVWLEALHAHRGTVTGGPAFGLSHLLARLRPRDLEGLDLSSVHTWLVGAEPIPSALLAEAGRLLHGVGLAETALAPGYGLAEATLAVTMSGRGERPRTRSVRRGWGRAGGHLEAAAVDAPDAVTLVDCGPPVPGVEVRVVGPEGVLPEDHEGSVEVRGPTVSPGRLDGPHPGTDGWLETGDLGVISGGRLFVTGRRKDALFEAGRTLYAHDVEAVAEALPEVRAGGAALALQPDDARRTLVVALAPGLEPTDALPRVADAVAARVGIAIDEAVAVRRSELPRTTSGKLRRFLLSERIAEGLLDDRVWWRRAATAPVARGDREVVRRIWAEVLRRDPSSIGDEDDFQALGGRSILAADVHARLEDHLGRAISPEMLLRCRTVAEMSAWLEGAAPSVDPTPILPTAPPPDDAIAVVGLAVRVPGADDADGLWRLLEEGRCAIGPVPPSRFDPRVLLGEPVGRHLNALRGSLFDDPHAFDPEPFGLPEAAVQAMDPQQRFFLAVAHDALGQVALPDRVGVYAATGDDEHSLHYLEAPEDVGPHALLGALRNMVAARVSAVLGLTGPSLTVDTACSSSLMAVHLAMRALAAGECGAAVVGGVQLTLTDRAWRSFAAAGLLSPDGESRPFDETARGLVPGEAAVALVLKPLGQALADGDRVRAVLRGSAVTNDGGAISGTAPNPAAQRAAIAEAWARADLDPSTAGYVEAHAAGTAVGDALEVGSLQAVFADCPELLVGSVKANLGHTLAAAGALGLVRTVLAIERGQIPPSVGCARPAARIGFERGPVRPCLTAQPWPEGRRRAGVDSFGLGGTNVHVVVEAAPTVGEGPARPAVYALAGPPGSLSRIGAAHQGAAGSLGARAAAAARRARWGTARRAAVFDDPTALDAWLGSVTEDPRPPVRRVGLLCPGPGSQRADAGPALAAREPAFAASWTETGASLRRHGVVLDEVAREDVDAIDRAQVLSFAFGRAAAAWLSSLGLEAALVLGHSGGEVLAAHLAGVLDLDEAVDLAVVRGRAMAAAPRGAMAAVFAAEAAIGEVLAPWPVDLTLAARNAPAQIALSGTEAAIEAAILRLVEAGLAAKRIPVTTPAHSPAMAAAAEAMREASRPLDGRRPTIPWISSQSGFQIQILESGYWDQQTRDPVDFVAALRAAGEQVDAFVDLGARRGLASCAEATLGTRAWALGGEGDAHRLALEAVAGLWEAGAPLRLERLGTAPPVPLPAWPARPRSFGWSRGGPALGPDGLLDPSRAASAQDHRIDGLPSSPSALLIDHLLAQRGTARPVGLERVLVRAPLLLDQGPRRVRIVGDEVRSEGDDGERVHITARSHAPLRLVDRLDLAAARERSPRRVDPSALYALLDGTRFVLGPRMRAVQEVQVGPDLLVARLTTPPGADTGTWIDPVLLDGASQAVAAWFVDGTRRSGRPYLGFAIERLALYRPVRGSCVAVVSPRAGFEGDAGVLRFDVWLADPSGEVLGELRDVAVKRADAELAAPVAGKVQRDPGTMAGWPSAGPGAGLPAPRVPSPRTAPVPTEARADALESLRHRVAARLGRAPDDVGPDADLAALGLDSMKAVALVAELEAAHGVALPVTLLFERRTLRGVAEAIDAARGGSR